MKAAEFVTVVSAVLFVTFTTGDGAPQWRPQGRFGKRFDSTGLIAALRTVAENSEDAISSLFLEQSTDEEDIPMYEEDRPCYVEKYPYKIYRCLRRKRRSAKPIKSGEGL